MYGSFKKKEKIYEVDILIINFVNRIKHFSNI